MSLGMSYKPNVHQHIPGTSGNQVGNLQSPSAANLATLQSYRPLLSDYGPPSLGFSQVGGLVRYWSKQRYPDFYSVVVGQTPKTLDPTFPTMQLNPTCLGSSGSQVPQNKYAELLAIIEELGKEIRPTYAGSKSAMERLKRGIIHARGLVRECLAETERNARS